MSKEVKTTLVTADLGSFNIKLSTGGIYENRHKEVANDTDAVEGMKEYAITYEGKTYVFGDGEFDGNIIKAEKDVILPLLYGLGRDGVSGSINLILHLPSSQMPMKEKIIDQLKGKTFNFKMIADKTGKSVTINKVGILKEGFSSFYSLARRSEGLIAIVDIGGRTTDVFTFDNGKQEKEESIPTGTMDLFDDIALRRTGEGKITVMEKVKQLLDHSIINMEDFGDLVNAKYKVIKNRLAKNFPNLDDYKIYLCGGGAEYFENEFTADYPKVKVLSNNLTSNVDGAEKIGKAKGLDK